MTEILWKYRWFFIMEIGAMAFNIIHPALYPRAAMDCGCLELGFLFGLIHRDSQESAVKGGKP